MKNELGTPGNPSKAGFASRLRCQPVPIFSSESSNIGIRPTMDMMDGRVAALRNTPLTAKASPMSPSSPPPPSPNHPLPLAAYHVSGESLMVKAAAASGWIDEHRFAKNFADVVNTTICKPHGHNLG